MIELKLIKKSSFYLVILLTLFKTSILFSEEIKTKARVSTNISKYNMSYTNKNQKNIIRIKDKEPEGFFENYSSTTEEHFLRRTDIIFFIAIPLSILWTASLKQIFRQMSTVAGFFDKSPMEEDDEEWDLRAPNFSYSVDNFPKSMYDPFYVFTWTNNITWPLMIALNDLIERGSNKSSYYLVKKKLIKNRFENDLIHHSFN